MCVGLQRPFVAGAAIRGALVHTRLDRLVNLISAPLNGFLIFFGAVVFSAAHPVVAFCAMLASASLAHLPPEGWAMGAVAEALNLGLAWPR